jgi:hypothetical protein
MIAQVNRPIGGKIKSKFAHRMNFFLDFALSAYPAPILT